MVNTHEKVPNLIGHQGNTSQNQNGIPVPPSSGHSLKENNNTTDPQTTKYVGINTKNKRCTRLSDENHKMLLRNTREDLNKWKDNIMFML